MKRVKRNQIAAGVACLVLAVLLYLLDLNHISSTAGRTNVSIYPSIALAGLGLLFIARTWRKT